MNRCLVLFICKHIQTNTDIIHFLSCNKFMFELRYSVWYNQRQIITDKINTKILNRFTNIEYKIKIEKYGFFQTIYRKLFNITNQNITLHNLTNLKTLIINDELATFLNNIDQTQVLPASITHFGLHTWIYIHQDLAKKIINIIPKNITCFETARCELFDMLNYFPKLKKLIFQGHVYESNYFIDQIKKIPPNITSIYYTGYYYDILFKLFLSNISLYVTTLHIGYYVTKMISEFPHTILKLKIDFIDSDEKLPRLIKELHIGEIKYTYDTLLFIGSNVTKLVINKNQQHLLNMKSISDTCIILFKN